MADEDGTEFGQGWGRIVKAFKSATAKVEFGEEVCIPTSIQLSNDTWNEEYIVPHSPLQSPLTTHHTLFHWASSLADCERSWEMTCL